MSQRRYTEAEVREIFELAMQPRAGERAALPAAQGLTLTDIQEIGQEVGLAPADLARAASTLDQRGLRAPRRTSLGMPIAVGRIVPLPRALTDHEWDQLVAELRATFQARGRVNTQGGLREWTNGNLHAMVEPSESGYRLRLGTLKSDGIGWNAFGVFGIVAGAVSLAAGLITGGLADIAVVPPVLGGSGLVALLSNALRLPRWAGEREKQMEYIAQRVAAITGAAPEQP
jgi:hypothetical protein